MGCGWRRRVQGRGGGRDGGGVCRCWARIVGGVRGGGRDGREQRRLRSTGWRGLGRRRPRRWCSGTRACRSKSGRSAGGCSGQLSLGRQGAWLGAAVVLCCAVLEGCCAERCTRCSAAVSRGDSRGAGLKHHDTGLEMTKPDSRWRHTTQLIPSKGILGKLECDGGGGTGRCFAEGGVWVR